MSHNLDNPSTRWFFNDWDNEPGMKFCSLAAQGLWFKMLGLAARSREYGVVLIGDHPSLRTDLPALLAPSCGETVETIGKLVDDLITFKVAAVDGRGRVINRRMVREAKEEADRIALSAARSAAGRADARTSMANSRQTPKNGMANGRQNSSGKPMAKSGTAHMRKMPASKERLQSHLLIRSGKTAAKEWQKCPFFLFFLSFFRI